MKAVAGKQGFYRADIGKFKHYSNLVSLIISSKSQPRNSADFLQSTILSRKISKYSITGHTSVSMMRVRQMSFFSGSISSDELTTE